MLRHDVTHALPRALELLVGNEAQVAVRGRVRGHDVELARGRAADGNGVVGDVRAAHNDRRVERQVLLTAELRAEGVQNARDFVNRAVPCPLAEDARGMRLASGRRHAPGAGPAPRDGRVGAITGLERERDVAVLRGVDQRPAGVGERLAGMLLVAGEHDRDVHVAQRPRALQRFECIQNHHVAALHVGAAHGARDRVLTHPVGAAWGGLHDGIEMADEQHPHRSRLAAMLGDEVSRATDCVRHRHPVRRECKRVERSAEHRPDLADAVEIQRAAGDIDDALEVGDLRLARRGDGGTDALLLPVEARSLEKEEDDGEIH